MIIYLGNNLSLHGNTPSSIETLGNLLDKRYAMKRFSSKRNQVLRWLDMMYAIVRYHRTTNVVLIDTYSSLGFYYALGSAFLCRLLSVPYIPILRGGNLKSRLQHNPTLSRFVFGGANLLVAPSGYLLSTFTEFGFSNIQYIPNSIEIGLYEMKKRECIMPKLLWVRSFHKVYSPLMAMRVFEKLLVHYPKAELAMVGPDKDGSFMECKEYARKAGFGERIKFTGVLPKAEWHALSKLYDIFINTTTVDNTPVSVIEAMALGLPVVSTNVGGVPYLIANNVDGVLVESGDVEKMIEKILFLIENSNQAMLIASKARQKAEQFDWNHVKSEWFELLDRFELKK